METIIKLNISDFLEDEDLIFNECTEIKFSQLTDEHLTEVITEIILSAIIGNRVYFDSKDALVAMEEILPTITSIVFNPRFSHIKTNYNTLVEFVTYLTTRLA